MTAPAGGARVSRGPLVAVIALGVGLLLAPAVFGMFTAAPLGAEMIDDFRTFMDADELAAFDDHLGTIGGAVGDLEEVVLPHLRAGPAGPVEQLPATTRLVDRWPTIRSDMTAMLDDIGANVGNFAAVDALPPFDLFPWFFVLPGLLAVGLGAGALRAGPTGAGRLTAGLAVLGVALVAAPAVFGMFTRAPRGGEMIDDLRPLMTRERVTTIQDYFVTLGAAEGELRTRVLPALEDTGVEPDEAAPSAGQFVRAWPTIAADMAPMVGAMSDNLDNFAAIDGLPPFALFPWFFVAPGVLLVGLAAGAARPLRPAGSTRGADDQPRPHLHTEGSR